MTTIGPTCHNSYVELLCRHQSHYQFYCPAKPENWFPMAFASSHSSLPNTLLRGTSLIVPRTQDIPSPQEQKMPQTQERCSKIIQRKDMTFLAGEIFIYFCCFHLYWHHSINYWPDKTDTSTILYELPFWKQLILIPNVMNNLICPFQFLCVRCERGFLDFLWPFLHPPASSKNCFKIFSNLNDINSKNDTTHL